MKGDTPCFHTLDDASHTLVNDVQVENSAHEENPLEMSRSQLWWY